jgi:hypothetical protein
MVERVARITFFPVREHIRGKRYRSQAMTEGDLLKRGQETQ